MKNTIHKRFIGVIAVVLLLASCSKDDGPQKVVLNSAKQLSSFTFLVADNTAFAQDITASINEEAKTITATLPSDIDITALTPTLAVPTKASVSPTGAQDFTNPVIYTVTAEDGAKATYTATFVSNSSAKELTSFTFSATSNTTLSQDVTTVIDESTKAITSTLPSDTDVTVLIPTLVVSDKASVSPTGVQDFTNPVAYTVTAEDGSETIYIVTITKQLTQKEILQTILDANPNHSLNWDLPNTADSDLGSLDWVTTDGEGVIIELDLQDHNLSTIPVEIGGLIDLKELDLSKNNLSEIPKEIGKLENLTFLGLYSNLLTDVPAEVGNLVNLDFLPIHKNRLTEIPTEIGNLVKLEHLYIYDNKLTTIPLEIGNLVNLEWLLLSGNNLTIIPKEIGELVRLENIEFK